MKKLALALCLCAAPTAALELSLKGFYDLNRPASLEYDSTFCGLWIANEGPDVALVTLDGLEFRRFRSDMRRVKAIGLDGNDLLLADGFGNYQRMTKNGEAKGGPFRPATYMDTEGVVTLEDGTILMVEDDPARLMWLDPEGNILKKIDTDFLDPPLIEPQGLALDPRNGHILITDDWEGTNSLFELSPEGEVLSVTPLIAYGSDPEGIALRPGTNTIYIAFDSGARIAEFDYTPTGGGALEDPQADCMLF